MTNIIAPVVAVPNAAKFSFAVILAAFGLLPTSACLAEGAFAFSQGARGAWQSGSAYNYDTADQAQAHAIDVCRKAGGSSCRIIAKFSSKCFSIAVQEQGNAWGSQIDYDYTVAEQAALDTCGRYGKACSIKASVCDGQRRPADASVGTNIPKIFSYSLYDNVVGITIFGPILPGDESSFKTQVLSNLRAGKLIALVRIFSPGGDTDSSMRIGEQIRTLQAQTEAPLIHDGVRSCSLDVGFSRTGSPIGGAFGILNYDSRSGAGDSRCQCESGCSLIWLGGLGRSGQFVGIHRFRFDGKIYAGLSLEDAQKKYQSELANFEPYLTKMGVTDDIKDILINTASVQMHYLTADELALLRNFPAYLEELILARCGKHPAPGSDESPLVSWQSCKNDLLKENMRVGADIYLKKYGTNESFAERSSPASPAGVAIVAPNQLPQDITSKAVELKQAGEAYLKLKCGKADNKQQERALSQRDGLRSELNKLIVTDVGRLLQVQMALNAAADAGEIAATKAADSKASDEDKSGAQAMFQMAKNYLRGVVKMARGGIETRLQVDTGVTLATTEDDCQAGMSGR